MTPESIHRPLLGPRPTPATAFGVVIRSATPHLSYGRAMTDWVTTASIARDWALPLLAAIIGAAAGGYATWRIARVESKRVRRERYGQALLDALGSARIAVQAARGRAYQAQQLDEWGQAPDGPEDYNDPLSLPREARDIWVNSQLAATLERDRTAKLALSGWALHHHESLLSGADRIEELDWLDDQLQLGEYVVVAWVAGDAPAIDFKLDKEPLREKYAPKYTEKDVPDYGSPAR